MFQWQTLKLFLSSTFKDLELQRDELSRIFGRIKESLCDRQLFFSPYDLRWRHRHKGADVVRWCLEMVEECQYFVGILGYRYGWRPDRLMDGKGNVDRISITEMEIREALQKTEKSKRLFLFGDSAQYAQELAGEPQEDIASLEALKKWLEEELKETVYHYKSGEELLAIIEEQVQNMLDSDYPPGTRVPLIEHTRGSALREILEEKQKGFVGRGEYLKRLEEFAQFRQAGKPAPQKPAPQEKNFLTVHAIAGTGKSALLARFLDGLSMPWIAHYMSQGLDSRSVDGVMRSLGEQLRELGWIGELEPDPAELRSQVRSALEQAETPLIVAIDGLDEMEENGKSLGWLLLWDYLGFIAAGRDGVSREELKELLEVSGESGLTGRGTKLCARQDQDSRGTKFCARQDQDSRGTKLCARQDQETENLSIHSQPPIPHPPVLSKRTVLC